MQNYPRFAMPTGRFDPYFAGIWPGNLMLKPPEPAKTDGRTHSQTPSKSRAGKPFEARLVMVEGGLVKFEFGE